MPARSIQRVIRIRRGDRVFISGQSGTGKTTLALELFLSLKSPLKIIIDIKDENMPLPKNWVTARTTKGLVKHVRAGESCIVFIPPIEWNRDTEQWNLLFKYLYMLGNNDSYIDEGYAVSSASDVPLFAEVIATRGRSRKVGLWVTCQRPANIAVVFRTEANHAITFGLANPDDMKRVEHTFQQPLAWDKLQKHDYYYKILGSPLQGPFTFGYK